VKFSVTPELLVKIIFEVSMAIDGISAKNRKRMSFLCLLWEKSNVVRKINRTRQKMVHVGA
jgi:hypothetical protein